MSSNQDGASSKDQDKDEKHSPIDCPTSSVIKKDHKGNYGHGKGEPSATQTSSSSPIDIRQASCGKFGVFQARLPSPDSSRGIMIDNNGEPIPIDKLIKTANTMSSMMMAHKIALEDDFRLEPGMDITGPLMSLSPIIGSSPPRSDGPGGKQSEPSLHNRVKDIVHEAYWDLFREELDSQIVENLDDRKYDISKQLLADIKLKILELLLPQHARLKQDIQDKLDAQIIDQLAKAHSIKLIDYGYYILSVLSKLCAPVRDERLKELSETKEVVQMYRGIMEVLELMRLDFANFTLNRFKPHIKAHSQDYEREKFNEILKQQRAIGIDGLEHTKIWLERAVKRVDAIHGISELINETTNLDMDLETTSATTTTTTTSGSSKDAKNLTREKILSCDIINKILNTAYCELLEWSPETQKSYPETLLFDEATFKQLAEQYKVLLLTSSILLTVFAFINRLKLQDSNEFKVLIKSHIITLLTASYDNSQSSVSTTRDQSASGTVNQTLVVSADDPIDAIKLETVATRLCDDIRQKIQETNKSIQSQFEDQQEMLKRQILDLQSSSNRIRELARRRILEFVETLLDLDVKHQQKKFSSNMPPPVNIPLGLHCLTDEITLTMAQLVKIIRYNKRVFFQHYQDIIADHVSKLIKV